MDKIIEMEILEVTQEHIKILKDRVVDESTVITIKMKVTAEIGIGTDHRDRPFSRYPDNRRNDRSMSNSRSRSGSRASTNRDRIRCYKCREYDHFARDCPTSREERELEQLQQMLNLDGEKTSLKSLTVVTHDSLNKINSEEDLIPGYLNLYKVKMTPLQFFLLALTKLGKHYQTNVDVKKVNI